MGTLRGGQASVFLRVVAESTLAIDPAATQSLVQDDALPEADYLHG
jgi:hypothetical protein